MARGRRVALVLQNDTAQTPSSGHDCIEMRRRRCPSRMHASSPPPSMKLGPSRKLCLCRVAPPGFHDVAHRRGANLLQRLRAVRGHLSAGKPSGAGTPICLEPIGHNILIKRNLVWKKVLITGHCKPEIRLVAAEDPTHPVVESPSDKKGHVEQRAL